MNKNIIFLIFQDIYSVCSLLYVYFAPKKMCFPINTKRDNMNDSYSDRTEVPI